MTCNRGYVYRAQVDCRAAGTTLLAYLSGTWRHSTSDEWAARLELGEIELDGARAHSNDVLRSGQRIAWHRPPWIEPDVPRHFDVLHEDHAMVAVAKPSGLPTMPAGGFLANTLLALVRERYPEARPMHRLGRHTTGVVLFARNPQAASRLAAAWRQHAVQKRYQALACGVAARDHYIIDSPIGPVAHPVIGSVHAASAIGKPSQTHATVLERRATTTLFEVDIRTGRPHPVRIHLAYAGHPLLGDPLYGVGGVPRLETTALPGDGGYFLHAARLRFVHPDTGVDLEIHARPPTTFCEALRRYW